jgi:lipoprotein-releasing system permease protein
VARRIGAVFHVGESETDRELAFTTLATAQRLAGRGDAVTGIDLELDDLAKAGDVAERLRASLGPAYAVTDWEQLAGKRGHE